MHARLVHRVAALGHVSVLLALQHAASEPITQAVALSVLPANLELRANDTSCAQSLLQWMALLATPTRAITSWSPTSVRNALAACGTRARPVALSEHAYVVACAALLRAAGFRTRVVCAIWQTRQGRHGWQLPHELSGSPGDAAWMPRHGAASTPLAQWRVASVPTVWLEVGVQATASSRAAWTHCDPVRQWWNSPALVRSASGSMGRQLMYAVAMEVGTHSLLSAEHPWCSDVTPRYAANMAKVYHWRGQAKARSWWAGTLQAVQAAGVGLFMPLPSGQVLPSSWSYYQSARLTWTDWAAPARIDVGCATPNAGLLRVPWASRAWDRLELLLLLRSRCELPVSQLAAYLHPKFSLGRVLRPAIAAALHAEGADTSALHASPPQTQPSRPALPTVPSSDPLHAQEQAAFAQAALREALPTSVSGFRAHPGLILASQIGEQQVLQPANAAPVALFKGQRVYNRAHVAAALPPRTWLSQHARLILDAARASPVKLVQRKVRAASASVLDSGRPQLGHVRPFDPQLHIPAEEWPGTQPLRTDVDQVPLYTWDQTQPYDPGAVGPTGRVPTNRFGSVSLWRGDARFLPRGAVHLRGIPQLDQVCSALRALPHWAPATVRFEFSAAAGAVQPVHDGVVVAAEWEGTVRAAARAHDQQVRLDRAVARSRKAIANWKRFVVSLRARAQTSEHMARVFGPAAEQHQTRADFAALGEASSVEWVSSSSSIGSVVDGDQDSIVL